MTNGRKCMEMIDGVNAAEKFDPFLVILAASKLDGFTSKAWVRYRSVLATTWSEVLMKITNRAKNDYSCQLGTNL